MWYRRIRLAYVLTVIVLIKLTILSVVYINTTSGSSRENDVEYVYSERLKLDNAAAPNETELYARVSHQIPSLPLEQLLKNSKLGLALNKTCAPYPDLYDINYFNNYWQLLEKENVTLRLFGAYYDKRPTVPEAPLVRILAMINAADYESTTTYCQIWFFDVAKPALVPTSDFKMIWFKVWGNTPKHIYPHLFACRIPPEFKKHIPQTVSIVNTPCELATNNLKVYYEPPAAGEPEQTGFAVCVKALDFPYVDFSVRLIEWLEVQRQLGARRVTIHNMQLHPNSTRVLEYYHSTGFVDFRPYSMGRGEPNIADFGHIAADIDNHNRILHEIIPYNDCFYRNLYKYEFMSAQDVDEVIMPLGNLTDWQKMWNRLKQVPDQKCPSGHYASMCFRNVYYPRYPEKKPIYANLPEYFYLLQHVERVREHLDPNLATKCFHNTKYALTLHNHFPLAWIDSCRPLSVNATIGQMQHYREPDIKETLNDPVIDDNIWRFKNEIVNRTTEVLEKLGFLEKVKKSELQEQTKFS